MRRMSHFRQCTLARGTSRTVGWIEERAARVGASVELTEDEGRLWRVVSVGDRRASKAQLDAWRRANRHPSLEDER